MIRYVLTCELNHGFEGWFRNSGDFDAQCANGLVCCPVCGSSNVHKGLMAPAVATARTRQAHQQAAKAEADNPPAEVPSETSASTGPAAAEGLAEAQSPQQTMLVPRDVQQKELIEALRSLRQRVVESSDYVGKSFSEEARKMHYGDAEERSIYGETTLEDAEALAEEGIAVMALPILPEEKN